MSAITVEIPDSVRAALDAAARRERKSAEQVAGESLARVVQAQQQLDYLAERAHLGRLVNVLRQRFAHLRDGNAAE